MHHLDVVVFGQQNWDVTWTEKQQFSTRLARRGHRVLYVDPVPSRAAGVGARARSLLASPSGDELRCLEPGRLWLLSLHRATALGGRLEPWRRSRAVRHAARRLGLARPAVLAFRPHALPDVRALRPSGLVYYAVDEWTGFYDDAAVARAVRAQEEAMLRASDVAIGISPRLRRRFAEVQPRTYLLTNGVDAGQFGPERLAALPPHPALDGLPRPRLGLVGQIDRRVDQRLLHALAEAHPEWQLVLVGRVVPEVDVSALAARPNVHLVGFQPHERLPQVLGSLDVCLIPYHLTALTHSCNPAKAYEYLATGLPIVATPLEGLGELHEVVSLAATPESFVRAVERALACPAHGRAARLATAAGHDWERRTDAVEARLTEAVERHAARAAAARRRLGAAAEGRAGERLLPLLDAGDDAEFRVHRHVPDRGLSPRARLALRLLRPAGRAYWAARVAGRVASGRRPWRVRRILVSRPANLGDLVVFLPALAALRARYPGAHVTLGVHRGFDAGAVLEPGGSVDEVREIEFPHGGGWRRALAAARLFLRGYDLVVQGADDRLLREALLTGAPRVAGIDDGHPLQAELDVAVPVQPLRHEAENNLAVVEALGGVLPPSERAPRLPRPSRVPGGADLLARLGLPADVPLLAMHPGSRRPSHRWPAERFAQLAAGLLSERPALHVVLTGVAGDHALDASVRALVPPPLRARVVNAAGACDLRELRALLAASEALVCNDGGVMHLARAQGTPLVALLGPENAWRWGPHALGPAPAVALQHQVPCAPCGRHECEPLWCLRSLAVEEVHAALQDVSSAAADWRDADGVLVPLERRVRRHDWHDLADDGFELPLVTVVLTAPTHAHLLGAADPAGAAARATDGPWRDSALRAIAAQRYPRLEVIVVGAARDAPSMRIQPIEHDGHVERVVAVDGDGRPADVWRAVLREARGAFLCATSPGGATRWRAERLAADVAALVRMPAAGLTSALPAPLADLADAATASGPEGHTFRRAALVAAFDALRDAGSARAPGTHPVAAVDRRPATLDGARRTLLAGTPAAVSGGFVPLAPA